MITSAPRESNNEPIAGPATSDETSTTFEPLNAAESDHSISVAVQISLISLESLEDAHTFMKPIFAWTCPTFAGSGDVHPDTPCLEKIDFDHLRDTAQVCEQLGYDALWVADHMMLGRESAIFECWTTLTALATMTHKMRLGALGLTPEFRNPAVSAKMIATFDVICNGRFDYLIRGVWAPDSFGLKQWGLPTSDEFDAYAATWTSEAERIERAREVIRIAERLWTRDDVTFEGKYYKVKRATCNPKPIQKPRPPIIVEGDEEKYSLKLAAEVEGWIGAGSPSLMKKKIQVLKNYCEESHTGFEEKQNAWIGYVLTAEGEDEYKRKLNEISKLNPNYPLAESKFLAENMMGLPEEIVQKLNDYIHGGVNYFAIFFLDYPSHDSLKLFANNVLPKIK